MGSAEVQCAAGLAKVSFSTFHLTEAFQGCDFDRVWLSLFFTSDGKSCEFVTFAGRSPCSRNCPPPHGEKEKEEARLWDFAARSLRRRKLDMAARFRGNLSTKGPLIKMNPRTCGVKRNLGRKIKGRQKKEKTSRGKKQRRQSVSGTEESPEWPCHVVFGQAPQPSSTVWGNPVL